MKSTPTLIFYSFLLFFSFQSCTKEEDPTSANKNKVTFSFKTNDEASVRKASELENKSIFLSLRTSRRDSVWYTIKLIGFGSSYGAYGFGSYGSDGIGVDNVMIRKVLE